MDSDRYSLVALSVTIGISLLSLLYFGWFHRRSRQDSPPSTGKAAFPTSNIKVKSSSSSSSQGKSQSNDVWEERRRRGIAAASMHVKADVKKEHKPFGSSYYYAHNSTKAAGGYKDGLTMEDFTMNGPRLLARNGKPVDDDDDVPAENMSSSPAAPDASTIPDQEDVAPSKNPASSSPARKNILINRYLWDDPGKGVGTIRIDVVPSSIQAGDPPTIPWSEIRSSITNISATLLPNDVDQRNTKDVEPGLQLEIKAYQEENEEDTVVYTLRIPRLYGPVEKVETVNKEKRLLIRLHKKTTWLDKTNLHSWPHPHKAK